MIDNLFAQPGRNQRPFIKICGLTEPETAHECAAAGADAIGLVFFQKSPRNVSIDQAAAITRALPASTAPIGVFVDQPYDTIMKKVHHCGLLGIQLHGSESPKLVEKITGEGIFVIKALFAAKAPLLNQYEAYEHASCILVEYGKGILPGGNAETWDYEQSSSLNQKVKLILAGGLHPGNVHDAVTRVNPFGVDVSSGVEKIPGVKDMHKVTAFIDRLRKNKISGANVQ